MRRRTLGLAFAALFVGVAVSMAGLDATPILNASFESVENGGTPKDWGYIIDDWYENENPTYSACFYEKGSMIDLVGDGLLWAGTGAGGMLYQDIGTVDDSQTYSITALIGTRYGTSFDTGSFCLYASTSDAATNASDGVELSSFATLLSTISITVSNGVPTGDTNVYTVAVNLPTGTGHAGEVLWLGFESVAGKDYFDNIAIAPSAAPTPPAPVWTGPVTASTGIVTMAYSDSLANKAIDENGDAITYGKTDGPAWLTVAPGGALGGTPDVLGTNTFTVTATDGTGTNATTLTLFVRATLPPEWAEPVTRKAALVNEAYDATLEGQATDPDGGTITYSLTDVGTWLSVATNGVLSGTPASGDQGMNTFTVVADDGVDTPTPATLSILVKVPVQAGRHISVNFIEDDGDQGFAGGQLIGPLETDSSNWNNTINRDSGTLATGTMADMKDDTGTPTTADISWASKNVWSQGDGTTDDEHKISVGYLDDGDGGPLVTVSNIPYASYRVYGLFSSGQAEHDAMEGKDFDVNGTWAYGDTAALDTAVNGTITGNHTRNGEFWTEIVPGSIVGNYWTVETSGSTLVVDGQERTSAVRGSLAGIIIEEVGYIPDGPVADLVIAGPFAGGMELSWTGKAGKFYGVQTNSNLILPNGWASWITNQVGNGGSIAVTNAIGPDQTFFRVISE